eukprot:1386648-Amorphochlora_amoeboformis.AAC.1
MEQIHKGDRGHKRDDRGRQTPTARRSQDSVQHAGAALEKFQGTVSNSTWTTAEGLPLSICIRNSVEE